ncbi:unnamed protein product, partial [Brachionus calyciflorus]
DSSSFSAQLQSSLPAPASFDSSSFSAQLPNAQLSLP